jgi:hypothetical protein
VANDDFAKYMPANAPLQPATRYAGAARHHLLVALGSAVMAGATLAATSDLIEHIKAALDLLPEPADDQ